MGEISPKSPFCLVGKRSATQLNLSENRPSPFFSPPFLSLFSPFSPLLSSLSPPFSPFSPLLSTSLPFLLLFSSFSPLISSLSLPFLHFSPLPNFSSPWPAPTNDSAGFRRCVEQLSVSDGSDVKIFTSFPLPAAHTHTRCLNGRAKEAWRGGASRRENGEECLRDVVRQEKFVFGTSSTPFQTLNFALRRIKLVAAGGTKIEVCH